MKEFDEHNGDLSIPRPISIVRIDLIPKDLVVQEVPSELPAVTQTLNGTVHVASVSIVSQPKEAFFGVFFLFKVDFLWIQLVLHIRHAVVHVG